MVSDEMIDSIKKKLQEVESESKTLKKRSKTLLMDTEDLQRKIKDLNELNSKIKIRRKQIKQAEENLYANNTRISNESS